MKGIVEGQKYGKYTAVRFAYVFADKCYYECVESNGKTHYIDRMTLSVLRKKDPNASKAKDKAQKQKRWIENLGQCVYFITCEKVDAVKIGITADVTTRLVTLQVGNPYPLALIAAIRGGKEDKESELHEQFKEHYLRGEWFDFADPIKQFILADRSVKLLKREAISLRVDSASQVSASK